MSDRREEEPQLPRPLEAGEFYCWICKEFAPTATSEAHMREHRLKGQAI